MPFESPHSIKRLATEEFVSYPLSGLFSTNGWRRGFSSSRERMYAGGLFFLFFWVCCFFLWFFFFFLLVDFWKYCFVSRSGRFFFFLPQFSFSCTDKHRVHIYTNTHPHTHNLSFVSPCPPAPCVWKQTQQTSRLPGSEGILGNHGWETARVKVKNWWDFHHHNTPLTPHVHAHTNRDIKQPTSTFEPRRHKIHQRPSEKVWVCVRAANSAPSNLCFLLNIHDQTTGLRKDEGIVSVVRWSRGRIQECRQSAFISALIKPLFLSDLKSQLAENFRDSGWISAELLAASRSLERERERQRETETEKSKRGGEIREVEQRVGRGTQTWARCLYAYCSHDIASMDVNSSASPFR